ncbi:peptidoglycan DD-metalloendopeptidase family protein [Deinococcus yavapaiensis]|uniref:Murein DD-endopeptidase MepM/ murein hydrolase activator NlpD n=1 Tax=Deinococcus yavapaiensis KR-236 TaxID=694435 RepID=A0A318S8A8_9DEIO|nr:M23 family metallopeptidase [Deinococcus yavapaiensis]PYE55286.1 murein DD-endopeptidase MepM/ murein hydrolase activator NlpD [Deinococcus yavapaiensis KR-236]
MLRRVALPTLLLSLGCFALASLASAYVVQKGDTLYRIAARESVTVDELKRLNNLSSESLSVGQNLKLPSEAAKVVKLSGLEVEAPSVVRQGEAFSVRLRGARAAEARVRFLSETSEDVRSPAEDLAPFGAGGEYAVLGRVVLGQTKPLVYEVRLGSERITGSVPVKNTLGRVQNLNLPSSTTELLQDPGRAAEDALVEKAYARRTPQAWTKPFAFGNAIKVISSGFGQPRRYNKDAKITYHYGVDFPGKVGTPVLAINDGTVVIAGTYPVRGGLVVVDHGLGVVSLYFHQSKLAVKIGQKVTRGQKLGEIGTTGFSSGPHLHLEVRVRGEATDPADWFGKLLP